MPFGFFICLLLDRHHRDSRRDHCLCEAAGRGGHALRVAHDLRDPHVLISLIIGIIGAVLSLVLIGYLILLALVIWQLFRFVRGLIRAIDGRPIEDPEGWL